MEFQNKPWTQMSLPLVTGSNVILRKIYIEVDWERKETLQTAVVWQNVKKMPFSTYFILYILNHDLKNMEIKDLIFY